MECSQCKYYHSLGGVSFACKLWDHRRGGRVAGRSLMTECQSNNFLHFSPMESSPQDLSPINLFTDIFKEEPKKKKKLWLTKEIYEGFGFGRD